MTQDNNQVKATIITTLGFLAIGVIAPPLIIPAYCAGVGTLLGLKINKENKSK
jgi:hypothetical protein